MSRQFWRSTSVPWSKRGNHPNGTESARPSLSSTDRDASVTCTPCAVTIARSSTKVLMPASHQSIPVFLNQTHDLIHLHLTESLARLQPRGLEPNLGSVPFAFNMHVRRFITVARVEEEAVGADAQDGRHLNRASWLLVNAVNYADDDRTERCVGIANDLASGVTFINDQHPFADAGTYPAVHCDEVAASLASEIFLFDHQQPLAGVEGMIDGRDDVPSDGADNHAGILRSSTMPMMEIGRPS